MTDTRNKITLSVALSEDDIKQIYALYAEIERLRTRINAACSILDADGKRGERSEGWCMGKCLKPRLLEALLGDERSPPRNMRGIDPTTFPVDEAES